MFAVGDSLIVSSSSKITGAWFGTGERNIAIAFVQVTLTVGSIIGLVLPLIFISDDDIYSKDLARDHMFNLFVC